MAEPLMKSWMTLAAEECHAYIKPWVSVKELDEKIISSCGCGPVKCTDWYISCEASDSVCSCTASEDCKKVIQEISDVWIEEPPKTNNFCASAFDLSKWMNVICIN